MRKSPKNLPEGGTPSGYSPWGHYHPPSGVAAPPKKGRHHLQLKYLRGCHSPYTSATNTARAEGGGIQGGPPPCAGGPGTRRFLAYLSQHLCCYFPLREKVGRGAGRSARSWGAQRGSAPRISVGATAAAGAAATAPGPHASGRKKWGPRGRPPWPLRPAALK